MINEKLYKLINKFQPTNFEDVKNAIKETMQEIILCGLAKGGFFNKCTFYGGTSLRILYGLSRFSEDLDFTLDNNWQQFDFETYLNYAIIELKRYGIESVFNIKSKTSKSSVISAYVAANLKSILTFTYPQYANSVNHNELIKIKTEVETNIISGGERIYKLLVSPSFSQIKTFSETTLFSSKLVALISRKWGNRVKGRDYYDYLFYISNQIPVDLDYLRNGLIQSGKLSDNDRFTISELRHILIELFTQSDIEDIKNDVKPFIAKNDDIFASLNKDILLQTVELLKNEK